MPPTESYSSWSNVLIAAVALLIGIPFYGIVLRYRVNYTPRSVALHADVPEGHHQSNQRIASVRPTNSLLGVFRRVWRIEGVAGLYKGTTPLIISGILGTLVTLFGDPYASKPSYDWMSKIRGVVFFALWFTCYLVFSILQDVFADRAIVTSYKLGWSKLDISLRTLLTPYERARPFRLFLTPGLFISEALSFAYLIFITIVKAIILPSWDPGHPFDSLTVRFGLYIAFLLFSVVILAPLDVLKARASVQRNHPINEDGVTIPAAPEGLRELAPYADEEVIGFRDESMPYRSLWDAVQKVVKEEGWYALYRAFYVTLAITLLVGLTGVFQST